MFGYVQPFKPELKIREFACYRSYYCGVCKALGEEYGQLSRFTVTYDAAFLALLNSSLLEDEERVCFEKCVVNPFKPKPVVRRNAAISYAAAVNLLMAYFKLRDNWRDDKNIIALLASGAFNSCIRRIVLKYPDMYRAVCDNLSMLAQVEKEEVSSVDLAAEPFAKLLSFVLLSPRQEKTQRRVLEWMGYNLGKWIYVIDAFSDIEKDVSCGSFNVLVAKYGKSLRAEENVDKTSAMFTKAKSDRLNLKDEKARIAEYIRKTCRGEVEFILNVCLAEIGKAYELLDIKRNGGLLENIIFLGLPYKTQMVLDERGEGDGSIQGTRCKARCNSGGDKGGL